MEGAAVGWQRNVTGDTRKRFRNARFNVRLPTRHICIRWQTVQLIGCRCGRFVTDCILCHHRCGVDAIRCLVVAARDRPVAALDSRKIDAARQQAVAVGHRERNTVGGQAAASVADGARECLAAGDLDWFGRSVNRQCRSLPIHLHRGRRDCGHIAHHIGRSRFDGVRACTLLEIEQPRRARAAVATVGRCRLPSAAVDSILNAHQRARRISRADVQDRFGRTQIGWRQAQVDGRCIRIDKDGVMVDHIKPRCLIIINGGDLACIQHVWRDGNLINPTVKRLPDLDRVTRLANGAARCGSRPRQRSVDVNLHLARHRVVRCQNVVPLIL